MLKPPARHCSIVVGASEMDSVFEDLEGLDIDGAEDKSSPAKKPTAKAQKAEKKKGGGGRRGVATWWYIGSFHMAPTAGSWQSGPWKLREQRTSA